MSGKLVLPVGKRDHIQGSLDAPVILVEYGDFECPFCGRAHPVVKDIQERLGEDMAFVFRHFPLSQMHPYALPAAVAAEAAGQQGKFWEMHDTLYENQEALEPEDLLQYAVDLGLDTQAFKKACKSPRLQERVKEDFMSGVRSGVNGTPSFYVNGLKYEGNWADGTMLIDLGNILRENYAKK